MKTTLLIIFPFLLFLVACTQAVEDLSKPITSENVVFEEKTGLYWWKLNTFISKA
jgi:hypothetical protein